MSEDRRPPGIYPVFGRVYPTYNTHYKPTNIHTLIKEYREKTTKWKLYKIAFYWNINRSVIVSGIVGYDQVLNVKECIELPKTSIEDTVKVVKNLIKNFKQKQKKDGVLGNLIFNDKKAVRFAIQNNLSNMRYQRINELELEEERELLESLFLSNKIVIPDNCQLSQKPIMTALLMLIYGFERRLLNQYRSRRCIGYNRRNYFFNVWRLAGDPDIRDVGIFARIGDIFIDDI